MMTALDLSEYKEIEQRTKDLISGYIRAAEKESFPSNESRYNIPISINYICALFYYIKEKWNTDQIGEDYEIIDDTLKRKTNNLGSEQSALLTNIARSGMNHWKFKLTKFSSDGCYMDFGIVKENANFDKIAKTYLGEFPNTAYVWSVRSTELNDHKSGSWPGNKHYGVRCNEDDVIDMYLDLDKLELSYAVNGKHHGKAFDVDSGYGYVGAVSLQSAGEVVLIVRDSKPFGK